MVGEIEARSSATRPSSLGDAMLTHWKVLVNMAEQNLKPMSLPYQMLCTRNALEFGFFFFTLKYLYVQAM